MSVFLSAIATLVSLPMQAADPVAGTPETPQAMVASVLGYLLLSAATTFLVALVYRWYFRERVGEGVAALVGVSAVATVLQTAKLSSLTGPGSAELFTLESALFNVLAIGAALAAAPVGLRVGDAAGSNLFSVAAVRDLDGDLGAVVRSVGRVTTVELPEEVADMESYDPVPESTKDALAGKTFTFPRRLDQADLRERLVTRLKEDFGVGHVDVELAADGEVTYLGVGSRLRGIGPTLAPSTAAVAVRADPPAGASPGDVVQVWETGTGSGNGGSTNGGSTNGESAGKRSAKGKSTGDTGTDDGPDRLLTAELRGVDGDVVTLAADEADVASLDGDGPYRLVTLPAEPQADREFASLLRAADETMGVLTVAAGSALVGGRVGDLDGTVVAVKPASGSATAVPPRSRTLAAADTLYVVARPETVRRLETEASTPATAPGDVDSDSGSDSDSNTDTTDDGSGAGAGTDPDDRPRRETQSSTPGTEE
ncbi:potassium transporter TrkA [Halobium salinum]|uniref:Potassium transporter TrkA n=1 Tax=Halobium salinum TaxID=1364940 RepID=A0ABD5P930_9EURY|nr:potassium transporter TrkA [Halobium salinum]